MEPRIQYAQTTDGVSIAYAVLGDGPPIVYAAPAFGGIHVYSSGVLPITQVVDSVVARGWRVIMYDGRGSGSSERGNTDFSLDGQLRDLEAVIERSGVERFALWGTTQGGPAAIAYVVKNPDRVSRLALWVTYARGADWYKQIPALRASRAADTMAEELWEYHTLALGHAATGFRDPDLANRFAAMVRSAVSANAFLLNRDANEKIDVTDLLPLVSVPTLVVHLTQAPMSNVDLLRTLASRIPNARLVATEDPAPVIDAFLREGEERAAAPELPSGTAIILFADIADSTALTERLGDAAFRAKARELDAALRAAIRERDGTAIEGKLLSATASSPSSRARGRRSRPRSPAAKRATTPAYPSTSASTPATSSARTTTSTAAPSTSLRESAGCQRRARCWSRTRFARWRARRRGCGSRTAGSSP